MPGTRSGPRRPAAPPGTPLPRHADAVEAAHDPAGISPYDPRMSEHDFPPTAPDDALIHELEDGSLYGFADYATLVGVIPGSGAGVYTIWDDEGGLVYVGIAGRNPEG